MVPAGLFAPPHTTAVGDPVRVLSSAQPGDLADAIRGVGFADAAFGVRTEWTDRVTRYRQVAEVRSAEYAAHIDDVVAGRGPEGRAGW